MGVVSATDLTASVEEALESHRRELTGYCYRMLGSGSEAEDAVQETMIRAWRASDRLDAREALRAWLYRIAHNVCLDMLKGSQQRARPMDLGPSSTAATTLGPPLVEQTWVMPIQDSRVLPTDGDPAEMAAAKETIKLAFVAALQLLPPKQRAVLILREVLKWQASEVAELLGTSVASVNSALQRARATIDASDLDASTTPTEVDGEEERDLLARYVDAFESYDVSAFVALLSEDAQFSMPPYDLWLRGPEQVRQWLLGQGFACKDSRLVPLRANGSPAFAQYKLSDEPGVRKPWAIVVIETDGERVTEICSFLGDEGFKAFGLPLELRDAA
jgi:RNA polymerase sigma-70 factor, ECF subfamily